MPIHLRYWWLLVIFVIKYVCYNVMVEAQKWVLFFPWVQGSLVLVLTNGTDSRSRSWSPGSCMGDVHILSEVCLITESNFTVQRYSIVNFQICWWQFCWLNWSMCGIHALMDFGDWHNANLSPLWSNHQKHAESVALPVIQAGYWNRIFGQLISWSITPPFLLIMVGI